LFKEVIYHQPKSNLAYAYDAETLHILFIVIQGLVTLRKSNDVYANGTLSNFWMQMMKIRSSTKEIE